MSMDYDKMRNSVSKPKVAFERSNTAGSGLSETNTSHFSHTKIENIVTSETLTSDWEGMLDLNGRGYLTRDDILLAIWCIGFEPTDREFAKVDREVDERIREYFSDKNDNDGDNKDSDDNKGASLKYPETIGLFLKYECTFENVSDCLSHWRFHTTTPRPDQFKFMSRWNYFFKRLLAYVVPILYTPQKWTSTFIPRYTEFENSVTDATAILYYVMVFFFFSNIISMILVISGKAQTVDMLELLSAYLSSAMIIAGGMSARECATYSIPAQRTVQTMMYARFRLYYVNFDEEKMTNGFGKVFQVMKAIGAYDEYHPSQVQQSAHNYFFQKRLSGTKRRKTVSRAHQEVELSILHKGVNEETKKVFAKKFSIFTVDWLHLSMNFAAFAIGFVPTFVAYLKDESNIFKPTHHEMGDYLVDALVLSNYFINGQFMVQILIFNSFAECRTMKKLSKFLCWMLDESSVGMVGTNVLGEDFTGDPLEVKMRLNCVERVKQFELLHDYFVAFMKSFNIFHLETFEIESFLALIATFAVVVSSIFGGEIAEWNSVLCLFAIIIVLVMTTMFIQIADSLKYLTKETVKNLQLQIHLNNLEIYTCVKRGREDAASVLEDANVLLDSLSHKVMNTPPYRLYGKVPLTSENIFKLMGALGCSLGATVLRAFLSMRTVDGE